MIDVLIIAVIYNTYEETLRFLKSIELQNQPEIKIILVDNSDKISAASFEEKINKRNSNISYLKSPENLGYFGGADYGLNFYLKNNVLNFFLLYENKQKLKMPGLAIDKVLQNLKKLLLMGYCFLGFYLVCMWHI